jgi:UDP-GlcNAc:undecaprenyl-phosphate/decaprenyl-phosphate GlcNAc-1-phosphate transferase
VTRGRLSSAAIGAVAARLGYAALREYPPGGQDRWNRKNHRGEPVTLLEGPAVVAGGVAGTALAAGLDPRHRAALLVAGIGAGAFGGYDDMSEGSSSKGFRGHLGALRNGELTSGAIKIVGIGAVGLAAAAVAGRRQDRTGAGPDGGSAAAAVLDLVINAGLIAGGANLLNLFDLRPGRAIKVALGAGGLLTAAAAGGPGEASADPLRAVAAPLAAAAALLPDDLAEQAMLGDAGANALGAMLGTAAAATLSRPARVGALAVIVGLTAASEVVSFTRVIERTAALRWLDMLGRRPAAAADDGAHSTVPATATATAEAEQAAAGRPSPGQPPSPAPAR